MSPLLSVLLLSVVLPSVRSCTNFLITKGASADGSTIISYAADDHTMYGILATFPAADHPAGTMRKVYDWDSGDYLGQIPEAPHTYNVVGNTNEFGLTISETTYGGLDQLGTQPGAIIDYGSLIYITLQRSRNAQEAITTMDSLTSQYGYASSGESFSIADPHEVWVMDLIGKGPGEKGAVWVARLIPDGYICSHANQARIRTFPHNENTTRYAADVVTFAQRKGLYPAGAPADQFSFADTFNPISFEGARFCESRVWSFFRKVVSGMDVYLDYVQGYNLTHRMPLWVKPDRNISVNDTMNFMRDHFEDTWLDFRGDVGAEGFHIPYRWRPLTWAQDGSTYVHERSVGTQQTGFSFIAQSRSFMPPPLASIMWFGVDDTASTVWFPVYGGTTRVPFAYSAQNGAMMQFSFDAAFWVFNMVSNYAYSRFSLIHPDILQKATEYENRFFNDTAVLDVKALELWQTNPTAAVELVTAYSEAQGNQLVADWLKFWTFLFTKYMDGNRKYPNPDPKERNPIVEFPGYPDPYYSRIVTETGTHYKEVSSTVSSPKSVKQRTKGM